MSPGSVQELSRQVEGDSHIFQLWDISPSREYQASWPALSFELDGALFLYQVHVSEFVQWGEFIVERLVSEFMLL